MICFVTHGHGEGKKMLSFYQLLPESRTAMLSGAAGLDRGVSTNTKIRKRCAVSVSPSDSQRRRLELRARLRLIGRSVGAASHCPSSSRIKRRMMSEPSWNRRSRHAADVETRSAASARKLVSALWQHGEGEEEDEGEVGWDAAAKRRSSSDHRRSASVEVVCVVLRVFVLSLPLGPALNLFVCFPAAVQAVEKKDQSFQG